MTNLHAEIKELSTAIQALFVQFPELEADEILRADTFEAETDINGVMKKLLDKLDYAACMITGIADRASQLNARKARFERHVDGLRSLIQSIMERASLTKLALPEATLSISFRKPAPIIIDEPALPDECVKLIRRPDHAVIKSWIEAGNIPAGVSMSNGKNVLSIRTK